MGSRRAIVAAIPGRTRGCPSSSRSRDDSASTAALFHDPSLCPSPRAAAHPDAAQAGPPRPESEGH